jgi:hypothetical protein
MAEDTRTFARLCNAVPLGCDSYRFSRGYEDTLRTPPTPLCSENPLWDYFCNHKEGHGIWKWEHYFEVYHRHFNKFIGKKVNVLEIGIYSGGSLEMWHSYFGEKSHVFGVDIEQACKTYENDHVSVFIGDQADRRFWSTFKKSVECVDLLIDDGGHTPEQQQVTLEEMLPHLSPGGVYLCEDIHGSFNRFADFAANLVRGLNRIEIIAGSLQQSRVSPFQSSIHSIHFYPYVMVIEKHCVPRTKLSGPKHGTEWQPFVPGGVTFECD